jgi:hypothetical protein
MLSIFAGLPSISYVQLIAVVPKTEFVGPFTVGELRLYKQVMSRGLLNGLIALLVAWGSVMLTNLAVGAAGDALRPAAKTGAAGPATNIAAPAPRAANAAAGRRGTNTEILSSICIPYLQVVLAATQEWLGRSAYPIESENIYPSVAR